MSFSSFIYFYHYLTGHQSKNQQKPAMISLKSNDSGSFMNQNYPELDKQDSFDDRNMIVSQLFLVI